MFFNTVLGIVSAFGVLGWMWSSRQDTLDDVRWLRAQLGKWWAGRSTNCEELD